MEEKEEGCLAEQEKPDGEFKMKWGRTVYNVKVFFDHKGQMTAEEKLKRVIQAEAFNENG